ncbi:amidohydrolase family protein [Salinicola sp. MIT1003]|uniref:amidohydrolase family protein n=1 Tax=Salinicola sp. MIT1003 TaxID=1882734 RepID=UPI0008DDCE61|nr:amidohydrolase family protein [Salinicola sp. MIT1003]OHZ00418.1 hypothetical protein BC443_16795 [Salinicola sp. MIT1003]
MIIDSHQHFWDITKDDYTWLTPDAGSIYRSFGPDDLLKEMKTSRVDYAITVQAANTHDDTRRMLEQAQANAQIAGVVAWLPLEDPGATAETLEEYFQSSVSSYLKGVRHLMHDEPDEDWIVRPDVMASLELLAERELPLDFIALWPKHIAHIPTLCRAIPDLTIVLDHLGKPNPFRSMPRQWADDLAKIARHDNVFVKYSGLNTPVGLSQPCHFSAQDIHPFLRVAHDAFGPDRILWGSDWPISLTNGSYRNWLEASVAAAEMLGQSARDKIMAGNAVDVYRLNLGGLRAHAPGK